MELAQAYILADREFLTERPLRIWCLVITIFFGHALSCLRGGSPRSADAQPRGTVFWHRDFGQLSAMA